MTIVVIVVGSILSGVATPTESAALGSIVTIAVAACYRSLSWEAISKALAGTAATTATIFIIISGSIAFPRSSRFPAPHGSSLQ
jgi:TRAP-type mannitol/chloroaromatic compound transport system permease large subunit